RPADSVPSRRPPEHGEQRIGGAASVSVRWIGAQRDVLGGDVEGKVEICALTNQPHLYALGPRAGVSGEITVFDGEPWIARAVDRRVHVTADPDHAACFLVYDHVNLWREPLEAKPIDDEHALAAAVLRAAA